LKQVYTMMHGQKNIKLYYSFVWCMMYWALLHCITGCWWQDTCWYPSHQDLLNHLENWPVHLDRRVCISHQAHRLYPWSPSCEPGMCKTWDIKHSEKEWWNSVSLYVNPSSIKSRMHTKWNSLNQNCNTRVLAVIF